jgi:wee1-like protein kinase
MPSYPSPIPPPIFDSDESDAASQQSNDSSSYLSSQFNQHTRLSFSPKLILKTNNQVLPLSSPSISLDDSINSHDGFTSTIQSTPSETRNHTSKKRKRSNDKSEQISLQTPKQSPYTRRKNLDYVQENTFQSPKIQRRSRQHDESLNNISSSIPPSNFVNINPFSPENLSTKHHYHTRLVSKRESTLTSSLRKLIIQRFEQEFRHESFLGYGEFSHVYLCTNRLDGLNYAIKTSKQTIIGTSYEKIAWREICAYAILTSHENLVRYYSGWIEPDGRFFVQLEYCNGGCLEDIIEKNRQNQIVFNEQQLKTILHQISDVLKFMHENDLAHMDIKPSNIMLCQYSDQNIIYKLTDLGHVSQISLCKIDEDGDSRYIALEVLNSKKINLDKCDIFSLGLTLYVCATNYNMPKQGNEWQLLRLNISQYLHSITQCTKQFNDLLLQRMCNIDPNQRPTAYEVSLLQHIPSVLFSGRARPLRTLTLSSRIAIYRVQASLSWSKSVSDRFRLDFDHSRIW